MSAEAIFVHRCARVDVHASGKQPFNDFHLVVVDGHVEQRSALEGCAMCREHFVMTAELRRIDFLMRERATQ